MKILHLIPSLSSGGVEQVVLELCEGLQAEGEENIVISGGGSMVAAIEATGARHIERPIGKKSLKSLLEIPRLRRLIRAERPDILHLHSRVPAWIGILACRGLSASERPAIITSFHGFHSVNAYSAIMAKGDRTIAVSESMKQHILENYPNCPEQSILVIPNSVDTELNKPQYRPSAAWKEAWQAEFPELKGKYSICLAGRITRLKGAEHLVPLLHKLHQKGIPAHALIIGECKRGKEAYKRELQELFQREGLSDAISWTGHRRDLRDIIASTDVSLSLTLQPESFGKTTLEALAMGRPVAGYEHGGVGEQLSLLLPEGKIPLGDTDLLAKRLSEWSQSPPKVRLPLPPAYLREGMIAAHRDLYQEMRPQKR